MGDTAGDDAAAAAKKRAGELKDAGNAALAKGAKGRALALYTEGLGLDPTSHVLLSNRSGVALELGHAGDAEADARAAIASAPEWPKGHFRLGAALEAQGRHAEAADAYGDALAADPGNADMARCRDRAAKAAEAEAAKGGAAAGGAVGRRPTHREALDAAQAVVDPASLPKVPRVEDLVAARHGGTLRLATSADRGRFLVAARPLKAYELLAAEPALFWAPPRVNDVGPMAPALWEVGPDVRAATGDAPAASAALLDAYLLQLAPFHAVAVERAAAGEAPPDAARPETGLPPLTRGELALRCLANNAHGICWAESGGEWWGAGRACGGRVGGGGGGLPCLDVLPCGGRGLQPPEARVAPRCFPSLCGPASVLPRLLLQCTRTRGTCRRWA
jgi:tetratricopeptide (TPR) repeat protein